MTKAFERRNSVVLVGAGGRVGRLICAHWPQITDAPVLLATSRSAHQAGLHWSPLHDGAAPLLRQLDGQTPTALIMLAGVTPGPGVDEAALNTNHALAIACLDAARQAGIGRVLLASSSAVYGLSPSATPFEETTPPAPLSPYGRAKLQMEQAAGPTRDAGMQVCALRIGNVAGADALLYPHRHRLADDMAPVAIDAFADGLGPLRSYIGPASFARVLARLATMPGTLPPVLNIAAPHPVRMTALAQAAGLPFRMVPAPPTAHQSITLDTRRLAQLCDMPDSDSLPETMVQEWRKALM